MTDSDIFRQTRIPLNHGSGAMPAIGFGTLTGSASQCGYSYPAENGQFVTGPCTAPTAGVWSQIARYS